MRQRTVLKNIAITICGWFFVILGFIGLFLPVLQGILFLLIGLYILSRRHHWARRLFERIRHKYPRLAGKIKEAQRKAESCIVRFRGR